MDVRILDIDGALSDQKALLRGRRPVHDLRAWGPDIRLACGFGRFHRFEQALADQLGCTSDDAPHLTYYGSGDFHHVSLALLRRLREPFNLLVLDNHPDWMCGVPFLHCGTWLRHASLLPLARRIFHVGGEVDFDNSYRWMAPWRQLRDGRFTVLPAFRRFRSGAWAGVDNDPLRPTAAGRVTPARIERLLRPHRDELAPRPLYISLDKDVMGSDEAVVNWDSGQLTMAEVGCVIDAFTVAAGGRVAGMDVVGDWSPVHVRGWLRTLFHHTMHLPVLPRPPGGEPLLHRDMAKIVEGYIERDKFVILCTNALLLAKKIDQYKPHPNFTWSIHLDGDKAMHDKSVCLDGTYEKAVAAIKLAKSKGFRTQINCTLFDGADPERTAAFFDEMMAMGVDGITVSPGYAYERAPDQQHFLNRERTKTDVPRDPGARQWRQELGVHQFPPVHGLPGRQPDL